MGDRGIGASVARDTGRHQSSVPRDGTRVGASNQV